MKIDLRLGDCLEVLKTIPDNSIDAVVTDPPYGLSFMGKKWDYDVPSVEVWTECLRVLKPGGHLLSFAGSRTYHRMGVAIEDAGFEIRDQIMWIYAQGFPKSHNISKSLSKLADEKERTEQNTEHNLRCVSNSNLQETELIDEEQSEMLLGGLSQQDLSSSRKTTSIIGGKEPVLEGGNNLQETEGQLQGSKIHQMFERIYEDGEERWIHNGTSVSDGTTSQEITNENGGSPSHRPQPIKQSNTKSNVVSEQLTSQEIREIRERFDGYGTALKPAHEPIVMARKPLSEKSIAENVLKHGTGGINIDGSRIEFEDTENAATNPKFRAQNNYKMPEPGQESNGAVKFTSSKNEYDTSGRFPANIIFDEEAGQLLDEQSGPTSQGHWSKTKTKGFGEFGNGSSTYEGVGPKDKNKEKGGASRFFYCPKAAKSDRNEGLEQFTPKTDRQKGHGLDRICGTCGTSMLKPEDCNCEEPDWITPPKLNHHPTVKPTDLMRYLINLVTPPNGTILDPFMGSGSTGKAAVRCGVNFIGIEKEQEYMDIASARIEHEKNKPVQTKLL